MKLKKTIEFTLSSVENVTTFKLNASFSLSVNNNTRPNLLGTFGLIRPVTLWGVGVERKTTTTPTQPSSCSGETTRQIFNFVKMLDLPQ